MAARTRLAPNATRDGQITVALRRGVAFPDWSAVTSPNARGALTSILSALKLLEQLDGYGEEEDRLRQEIIRGLADRGRALDSGWIAGRTGLDRSRVTELTSRLSSRDLVVCDNDTGTIVGAYPLTARPTEHRVILDGRAVHAMCAVDALGAGAMFRADVEIHSKCRLCVGDIRITTGRKGTALDRMTPPTAVVWVGIDYADGCAATSICTTIAFFCADKHLDDWRRVNGPDTRGSRLTVDEAMQVGRAIFGPLLKPAERGREEGS